MVFFEILKTSEYQLRVYIQPSKLIFHRSVPLKRCPANKNPRTEDNAG